MIKKGTGKTAILMLHGRGGDAEDIISLSNYFNATSYAFSAEKHEWYPFSFLVERNKNEPYLKNNLKIINQMISILKKEHNKVFLLGFSQGACLALDYGSKYEIDGIIAFSGAFIGDEEELPKKTKTKNVLICCSSDDPFIPLERAKISAEIYKKNGANVITNFYDGNTHFISSKDIELAKKLIEKIN